MTSLRPLHLVYAALVLAVVLLAANACLLALADHRAAAILGGK